MPQEDKKPKSLLSEPAGTAVRFWNSGITTAHGVTCELCGKEWPDPPEDEDYTVVRFIGKQVVMECCGRIIDMLYEEWGEDFTTAFLEDFASDPSDIRFGFLRFHLPDILKDAQKKADEVLNTVIVSRQIAADIKEKIPESRN